MSAARIKKEKKNRGKVKKTKKLSWGYYLSTEIH